MKHPQAPRKSRRDDPSEALFEAYLDEQQGVSYEYETEYASKMPEKRKHPDYRVQRNDSVVFCEVKGLHSTSPPPLNVARMFNPYHSIRKEIHEARRQFKEYKKDYCCVLVIHNVDDWDSRDSPYVLFGAMLGDYGLTMQFDPKRGLALPGTKRSAFLDGGKMIDPKNRRIQNTGISAIAVLSELTIPDPAFEKEYENRVEALRVKHGREPRIEEQLGVRMGLYDEIELSLGQKPRVSVFENPFAGRPLPADVMCGLFDERRQYNDRLGRIIRTYAGEGLKAVERHKANHDDIFQRIDAFQWDVVRQFHPERIILFGSYAYGAPDADSDVDLLIVFPGDADEENRALDIRKRISADFPMDLISVSAGRLNRRLECGDPFLGEIVANGKTLYEAGDN